MGKEHQFLHACNYFYMAPKPSEWLKLNQKVLKKSPVAEREGYLFPGFHIDLLFLSQNREHQREFWQVTVRCIPAAFITEMFGLCFFLFHHKNQRHALLCSDCLQKCDHTHLFDLLVLFTLSMFLSSVQFDLDYCLTSKPNVVQWFCSLANCKELPFLITSMRYGGASYL